MSARAKRTVVLCKRSPNGPNRHAPPATRLLEVDWLKNMWRPDSFFKNAKAVTFQTMTIPNHYMWLYKDKTILYMVK